MHSNSPRFITLEGGEGAGKSTQIKLLATWLDQQGISCLTTREPGGSTGAEEIRQLLVTGEPDRWHSKTEALLMAASRAEHVERTVKPALHKGSWVISDRFYDSSVAYQGAGRGLGMDSVKNLQTWALGDFKPHMTLILDMPVEVGLKRARGREEQATLAEDRFEKLDTQFHETIRQSFLSIAKSEPDRCFIIDAENSIDAIHAAITDAVTKRFGPFS